MNVIDVSSVAANTTGTATGASLTAAILIAAELAVVAWPSEMPKLKAAGPL